MYMNPRPKVFGSLSMAKVPSLFLTICIIASIMLAIFPFHAHRKASLLSPLSGSHITLWQTPQSMLPDSGTAFFVDLYYCRSFTPSYVHVSFDWHGSVGMSPTALVHHQIANSTFKRVVSLFTLESCYHLLSGNPLIISTRSSCYKIKFTQRAHPLHGCGQHNWLHVCIQQLANHARQWWATASPWIPP